jgi:hypothetical protein
MDISIIYQKLLLLASYIFYLVLSALFIKIEHTEHNEVFFRGLETIALPSLCYLFTKPLPSFSPPPTSPCYIHTLSFKTLPFIKK